MDTAKGLIQIATQDLTEIKLEQSESLTTNKLQQKPTLKSSLEIQETQESNDFHDEVLEKLPEELSLSNNQDSGLAVQPEAVTDAPGEHKKELAYQVSEIKSAFENKSIDLDSVISKLKDIMDNAYKMSAKDTPYDDYETRLKAIQTWAKLLQLGKPQSVYNVVNMRGKPPQIN